LLGRPGIHGGIHRSFCLNMAQPARCVAANWRIGRAVYEITNFISIGKSTWVIRDETDFGSYGACDGYTLTNGEEFDFTN
jgi:hypothetical protein